MATIRGQQIGALGASMQASSKLQSVTYYINGAMASGAAAHVYVLDGLPRGIYAQKVRVKIHTAQGGALLATLGDGQYDYTTWTVNDADSIASGIDLNAAAGSTTEYHVPAATSQRLIRGGPAPRTAGVGGTNMYAIALTIDSATPAFVVELTLEYVPAESGV